MKVKQNKCWTFPTVRRSLLQSTGLSRIHEDKAVRRHDRRMKTTLLPQPPLFEVSDLHQNQTKWNNNRQQRRTVRVLLQSSSTANQECRRLPAHLTLIASEITPQVFCVCAPRVTAASTYQTSTNIQNKHTFKIPLRGHRAEGMVAQRYFKRGILD